MHKTKHSNTSRFSEYFSFLSKLKRRIVYFVHSKYISAYLLLNDVAINIYSFFICSFLWLQNKMAFGKCHTVYHHRMTEAGKRTRKTMLIRLNDKRNKNDTPRVNGMMKKIKSTPKNQTVISICVYLLYAATKFKCFDYYVSWIRLKHWRMRIGNQIS